MMILNKNKISTSISIGFQKFNKNIAFTLVELLIVMASLGILIFVASSSYFLLIKNQRDLASDDINLEENRLATRLLNVLAQADISTYFANIPIPTRNCQNQGPCVLRFEFTDHKLQPLESQDYSIIGEEYIQLFSDKNEKIKSYSIFNRLGFEEATFNSLERIDLSQLPKNKIYLACWRLMDETSPPLIILKKARYSQILYFIESTGTSSPQSDWILVNSTHPFSPEDLDKIKLSYLLVFNSYDPRQFGIISAIDIKSCQQEMGFCQNLYPNASFNEKSYVFKIRNLKPEDFQHFPPTTSIPGWKKWVNSDVHPLIPSSWTIVKSGDPDLSKPIDPRKLAHFYHAHNIVSQILLIPFEIYRYRIESSTNGSKRIISDLILQGNVIQSNMEAQELKGGINLCRQLGTLRLQILF